MAAWKRKAGDDQGKMAHERETRPRGEFEREARAGETNRDHPDVVGAGGMKAVPGAGILSEDRRSSAGDGEEQVGRMERPGVRREEEAGERGEDARVVSAGEAADETADPNYSARRVLRGVPRDRGVARMDTSGKATAQGVRHSRDPRLVRDVMTADVEVCNPETELNYVGRMMMERDCGAIPVVESTDTMRPVGVVTDRDIVVRSIAKNQNPLRQRARDCMTGDVAMVAADALVEECVLMMEERQLRRVLVVDNTGRLCGIVAQADLARMRDEGLSAELLREVSREGMTNDEGRMTNQ